MTAMALRTIDQEDDWIVCLGETREVRGGWVACPRLGSRLVRVDECDRCRLLTWRHDERDVRPPCSTDRATTTPSTMRVG
jgi:hypothetical protein